MTSRISDFALIAGHTWRCYECRDILLAHPEKTCRGYKLTDGEKEAVGELSEDDYQTVMALAEATGVQVRDLEQAIDHPHARLRHLGSYRNHNYFAG